MKDLKIRLNEADIENLKKRAALEERSVAWILRKLVQDFLYVSSQP